MWAYMDDVTLTGPAEAVAEAFEYLVSRAEDIGLKEHPSKCTFGAPRPPEGKTRGPSGPAIDRAGDG